MFLDMLDQGYKLGLGFSVSFLWQLQPLGQASWPSAFRQLVAHPNCELVGVEPYHSFAFAIDIKLFQKEMKRGKDFAEDFFGKEIHVTDTTEMVMNNEIYYALLQSGYRAGMLDGRKWVHRLARDHPSLQLRRARSRPVLPPPRAVRRRRLPLQQQDLVGLSRSAPTPTPSICASTWGDFVFIGWDFETFGEHHNVDTGIFDFMRALPAAAQASRASAA